MEPTEGRDSHGTFRQAAIHLYGDTLIKFVERGDYAGAFAPGFRPTGKTASRADGVGLLSVDHIVGNVELGAMDKWVRFFADTMGFSQLVHFDDKTITTEYSALMSKVMQDGTGREIGNVTSGSPAPFLKKNIALAYVPPEFAAVGTALRVEIRGQGVEAQVVPMPFYKRPKKTA